MKKDEKIDEAVEARRKGPHRQFDETVVPGIYPIHYNYLSLNINFRITTEPFMYSNIKRKK